MDWVLTSGLLCGLFTMHGIAIEVQNKFLLLWSVHTLEVYNEWSALWNVFIEICLLSILRDCNSLLGKVRVFVCYKYWPFNLRLKVTPINVAFKVDPFCQDIQGKVILNLYKNWNIVQCSAQKIFKALISASYHLVKK